MERDWTYMGLFGRMLGGLLCGYAIGVTVGMALVAIIGFMMLFLGMAYSAILGPDAHYPAIMIQGNAVTNFFTGPAMQSNMTMVGKITGQCLGLTLGMIWPIGYYIEPNRATQVAPEEA